MTVITCSIALLFHITIRQEKLLLELRMRWDVTAVDLKFDWFSLFDKNNPNYEHGWLIFHFVSYFNENCVYRNKKHSLV